MDLATYVKELLIPLVRLLSESNTHMYQKNKDMEAVVLGLAQQNRALWERLDEMEARFLYMTPPALRHMRPSAES
jgi:hypothetical protein